MGTLDPPRGRHSRRALLRAALGTAGAALLAACGGETGTTPTAAGQPPTPAGSGATPTTVSTAAGAARTMTATPTSAARATRTDTVTPARSAAEQTAIAQGILRPSPAEGVPDVWLKLPPPFKAVEGVPGTGGRVRLFTITYAAPIPPKDQNPWLQELDKRLGVNLEVIATPAAGYKERYATTVVGGDLPELSWLDISQIPEAYQFIQQGAYADLTPYLTGEALKEFPNLAAFPAYMWKNVAINGKVYGVPRPQFRAESPVLKWRLDWAKKFGNPQPKNADEFLQLMESFTRQDPDGNGRADTYGLGGFEQPGFSFGFFRQMFRAPHGWRRNADGSLTNEIETEEYKQAVAYVRKLVDAGVYHPETATMTVTQQANALIGGQIGGTAGIANSIRANRRDIAKVNPSAELAALVPFGHDGGKAVTWPGPGFRGFVAIPAAAGKDKQRVEELLRLLDYLAAAFGSEEYRFLHYGIEGRHYELKDGVPQQTDLGDKELGTFVGFSTEPPKVLFFPDQPDFALELQGVQRDIMASGVENPAETLFSRTAQARTAELNQLVGDQLVAIFTKRAPVSALDQMVQEWRGRGGDQIRREYEQALREQR